MAIAVKAVRLHVEFYDYSGNVVQRAYRINGTGPTGLADVAAMATKIDTIAGEFDATTFCGIKRIGYGFVYHEDTTADGVFTEKSASLSVNNNQTLRLPVYLDTAPERARTLNFPGAIITAFGQGAGRKRDTLDMGSPPGSTLSSWIKSTDFAPVDVVGNAINTTGNGLLVSKESYLSNRRKRSA